MGLQQGRLFAALYNKLVDVQYRHFARRKLCQQAAWLKNGISSGVGVRKTCHRQRCANGGRCGDHKGSAARVRPPRAGGERPHQYLCKPNHPHLEKSAPQAVVFMRAAIAFCNETKSETPPLCLSQLNASDRVQIFARLLQRDKISSEPIFAISLSA